MTLEKAILRAIKKHEHLIQSRKNFREKLLEIHQEMILQSY